MGERTHETSFVDELPSALAPALEEALRGRRPAVFLDYDGTLTPIVDHPDRAVLSTATRRALERLAGVYPVAIVSGRDRRDVEEKVGLESIYYAGSHGFDISGPDGYREERGGEFRSTLQEASVELEEKLTGMEGVWVERKRYAVAVHFRGAPPEYEESVERLVSETAQRHPDLRMSGGKKIFELRPDLDWDKGRAVLWLREVLGLSDDRYVTVYVGDDETDEDAFRVLRPEDAAGLGIVVDGSHRPTAARFSLADVAEVTSLLQRLAELET